MHNLNSSGILIHHVLSYRGSKGPLSFVDCLDGLNAMCGILTLSKTMAIPLRSTLVRSIRPILPIKKANLKLPLFRETLATSSTSNYPRALWIRSNPPIYSPSARYALTNLGQAANFHNTGRKAILPAEPRESYIHQLRALQLLIVAPEVIQGTSIYHWHHAS